MFGVFLDEIGDRLVGVGGKELWTLPLENPTAWNVVPYVTYPDFGAPQGLVLDAKRARIICVFPNVRHCDSCYDGTQVLSLSESPEWKALSICQGPWGQGEVFLDPGRDRLILGSQSDNSEHSMGAYSLSLADHPVSALASLVSADALPDRARLTWYAAGSRGQELILDRRTASADWSESARVMADGAGYVVFEDRDVVPGVRYGYRLRTVAGVPITDETWLSIPAPDVPALGLPTPNPAAGALLVPVYLQSPRAARLELFDVAGRRVRSESLGGLAPGSHTVRVDHGSSGPGIYTLRLRQGTSASVRRFVWTR